MTTSFGNCSGGGPSDRRLHPLVSSGLERGDIHVWLVDLAPDAGDKKPDESCLSADERERAARFKFAYDRIRYLTRRAVRRQLLSIYLAISPADVVFVLGSHGKPAVAEQEGRDGLHFSCSHSGDVALIAIAQGRAIGVDLEQRRPLLEAMELAHSFFSPGEIAALAGVTVDEQEIAFFDCWARKEAYIKALGVGLSFPLNRFSVSLFPETPAALLEVTGNLRELTRWRMEELKIGPDYSAALVYEAPEATIQRFEWSPNSFEQTGFARH